MPSWLTAKPISPDYRWPDSRLVFQREMESVTTPNGTINRRVECRCDCGTVKVFRLPLLRNGKTKSCGCLAREMKAERARSHGGTGTPEYNIWLGMRSRCADLSNENYGGRGIKVCERWEDFALFLHDVGARPSPDHSIDRYPNNDGNYEPGNVRWATAAEQSRNTRANVLIEHDGETLCVADWAARYGITPSMLNSRLSAGMDFEKAVSAPSYRGDADAFYRTPISKRDAAWYREYEQRETNAERI